MASSASRPPHAMAKAEIRHACRSHACRSLVTAPKQMQMDCAISFDILSDAEQRPLLQAIPASCTSKVSRSASLSVANTSNSTSSRSKASACCPKPRLCAAAFDDVARGLRSLQSAAMSLCSFTDCSGRQRRPKQLCMTCIGTDSRDAHVSCMHRTGVAHLQPRPGFTSGS